MYCSNRQKFLLTNQNSCGSDHHTFLLHVWSATTTIYLQHLKSSMFIQSSTTGALGICRKSVENQVSGTGAKYFSSSQLCHLWSSVIALGHQCTDVPHTWPHNMTSSHVMFTKADPNTRISLRMLETRRLSQTVIDIKCCKTPVNVHICEKFSEHALENSLWKARVLIG